MSFMQEAVREWVWNVGQESSDSQWILSAYDTWERNPHYNGPDQGHPEDQQYDEDECVNEEEEKCIDCEEPFKFGVNIFTDAGFREIGISGICEKCFDSYFKDEE
jgi:hypothetical protein